MEQAVLVMEQAVFIYIKVLRPKPKQLASSA